MSYKKATITTDGQYFYCETGGEVVQCATSWSAQRTAVRTHREWILKQKGGHYDNGVRITLPDGSWRMGYLRANTKKNSYPTVVLDEVHAAKR